MEMAAAIELFKVVFQDVSNSDAPTVTAALRASRRLRSALEAREGELHLRLESLSSYPEKLIADTTKTSVRNAERKMKRATTAAQVPVLGTALALGKITGEHVDAYARAANELSMSERAVLALQSPRLALVGEHGSFEEFTHELKKAAVTAREDDGTERLKRQRRSTKLTTWTDRNDGMFCMHDALIRSPDFALPNNSLMRLRRSSLRMYQRTVRPSPERNKTFFELTPSYICSMVTAPGPVGPSS